MPSYDYDIVDNGGSVLSTETLVVPVESRDGVRLRECASGLQLRAKDGKVLKTLPILKRNLRIRRHTVPQRIAFLGTAPDNPHDVNRVSMKRLHRFENEVGEPEFHRRWGMTPAQAAEIWKRPEPPAPKPIEEAA